MVKQKIKKCKDCKGEGWVLIRCLPRGRKNSIVQCNHCNGTGNDIILEKK